MSERLNKLEGLLLGAWEQVRIAAESKERVATQNSLDRVAHLETLKQQEIALEKSIAESFSTDLPTDPPPTPTHERENSRSFKRGKRPTVRPKEVRIGACRKPIHYAYEIPITIANWLIEQGKALPTLHNFVHPSDSGFAPSAETKKLMSGQFIEIGDNQEVLIQKARKLLDTCGCRAQKLEVLFEDGKLITT